MPHDVNTGRIFRQTVGGVMLGIVDPADVCPILGTVERGFAQLCTDPNINPDALFKPYEHSSGPIEANFATGGPDGKYGFTIPETNNSIFDIYNTLWAHKTPQTWFNLQEFDKYNHRVRYEDRPWGVELVETEATYMFSATWGHSSLNFDNEYVCPKSMALFQNYYFAIAIFVNTASGWSFRYGISDSQPISYGNGCLISVAKSAFDRTTDTQPLTIIAIPFICQYSLYHNGAGTTNIAELSQRKLNINYKSTRYMYLSGTAPAQQSYELIVTSVTKVSDLVIRVAGTAEKLVSGGGNSITFWPLYRFYGQVNGYDELLEDEYTYRQGVTPVVTNLNVPMGQIVQWYVDINYLPGGNPPPASVSAIDRATIRLQSQSASSANTIPHDYTFN